MKNCIKTQLSEDRVMQKSPIGYKNKTKSAIELKSAQEEQSEVKTPNFGNVTRAFKNKDHLDSSECIDNLYSYRSNSNVYDQALSTAQPNQVKVFKTKTLKELQKQNFSANRM